MRKYVQMHSGPTGKPGKWAVGLGKTAIVLGYGVV